MNCTITEVKKVERDNALPYFVIKATGVQGDANASVLDENGFINPLACMSRTLNFTKTLFPATEEQSLGLEENVIEGSKIRLKLVTIASPSLYNIVKDVNTGELYTQEVSVDKVAEKDMIVDGKRIKKGETYKSTELETKVFNTINLTLFCDDKENSVEGDEMELAQRAWQRGITSNIYIPV